jgi:hypothetical protein
MPDIPASAIAAMSADSPSLVTLPSIMWNHVSGAAEERRAELSRLALTLCAAPSATVAASAMQYALEHVVVLQDVFLAVMAFHLLFSYFGDIIPSYDFLFNGNLLRNLIQF